MFLGISISCNRRPLFVRSVLIVMTYIAFLFFSLTGPRGGRTARGRFLSSFQNLLKTDSTKQVGIFSFGFVIRLYSQAYPTMPITFWALQVSFQPFQVCLQTTGLAWPNDQFHTKTKTRLRQRIFFSSLPLRLQVEMQMHICRSELYIHNSYGLMSLLFEEI